MDNLSDVPESQVEMDVEGTPPTGAETLVGGQNPSGNGLEIIGVSVSFGVTKALVDMTMSVAPGEIVALMGHNGAGKSTLLNAASGAVRPSAGSIKVDGIDTPPSADPLAFSRLGVTVIHQEPALAPNLSILDNLSVGRKPVGGSKERSSAAREALNSVGLSRDLNTPVNVLSLGERQLVDLARGLLGGRIRVLLLDEPTAALGAEETALLHQRVRQLSRDGTAVVYVSHRLPDVLDIADRIVVLRGGRMALDQPRSHFTAASLAESLAEGSDPFETTELPNPGDVACKVSATEGELSFRNGEIVGLFGVAAGRQFEILNEIFLGSEQSPVELEGAPFHTKGVPDSISKGVHLVPGDRENDGLISSMSAMDNVFLPWGPEFMSRGRIDRAAQHRGYESIREEYKILGPGGNASISSFSGGNRQKHLLARWVSVKKPRLLLLAQPTQGVDEGAKRDIRRVLRALAGTGVAVVVASAEYDEISALCSRVYSFGRGGLSELHANPNLDEQMLATLNQ